MPQHSPEISIVIPCLDEEASIPVFIPTLLKATQGKNYEIIIVDDNSSDQSVHLLKQHPQLKVIESKKRLGYGGALKLGFQNAQGRHLTFFDLDRTYNPQDIERLHFELQDQKVPIVFGDRMSHRNQMPTTRYFGNWLFAKLVKITFRAPINDVCTGFRLFERHLVPDIVEIKENDLSFSIAFTSLILKKGIPFSQVPIQYDRRLGQSKLSLLLDGFRFLESLRKNSKRNRQ